MKKIVFYFPRLWLGGTEIAMLNLIKRLHKKYDIAVCFDSNFNDMNMVLEISKYANVVNSKYKLVKCNTCVYVSLNGGYSNILADKYIQWNHTTIQEVKNFTKELKTNIDIFVSVSNEAQKQLKDKFNKDSIVIYNELNPDIDKLASEKVELKRAKLNLVTVARISQEKGFMRMLRMAVELKRKNIDFIWYIIGSSDDLEYERNVKKMFKNIPEVIFVGRQYNPYPYIKNADYGVMLSTRESYCIFIAECRHFNVPVIVTNWKSVEEQIVDGDNGYIVDMELSNLDIEKIFKKELKPNNKIVSEYKKWEEIL